MPTNGRVTTKEVYELVDHKFELLRAEMKDGFESLRTEINKKANKADVDCEVKELKSQINVIRVGSLIGSIIAGAMAYLGIKR